MNLPVVPEHKRNCKDQCMGDDMPPKGGCFKCKYNKCFKDCPACLYIKLAKYLKGCAHYDTTPDDIGIHEHYVVVSIPAADWAEIKRLAEEG